MSKEVAISSGAVDFYMIGEGGFGIGDTLLLGPKDLFALFFGDLGPGDEDDSFFEVIAIHDVEDYTGEFLSGPLYPKLSTSFEGARLTQLVQLVTAGRLFPCHKGQVDP